LAVLERELGAYRPELLERPRVVVGSRADVADEDVDFDGDRLSALTGEGLDVLVHRMGDAVDLARESHVERTPVVVHRPEPEGVVVVRGEDGAWEIPDRHIARTVNLNDLTNPEALAYIHEKLRSMGVDRALVRAGAKQGETVRIGRLEFDYEEDT
jgi:GTP-binding protein